jgi:hypothetical protein
MTPDATPPEDALQALPPAVEFHAPPQARRSPRRGGRGVLFTGVAAACVLGAGLGLWARPGMGERRLAQAAPIPAAGPTRTLQVVVDDRPGPVGEPMQVLPSIAAKPAPEPAPMALPTFAPSTLAPQARSPAPAPAAPPAVLQMASSEAPAPKSFATAKLAPLIAAAAAAPRLLITRLEAPKPPPILLGKADPPAKASAHKAEADRATEKAAAHRLALAQAAKEAAAKRAAQARAERQEATELKMAQAKAAQVQLAKAEATKAAAKADHAAKLAQAQTAAKAQKAEAIRLAKAEAKGRAEARAEARADAIAEAREEAQKQIRLASLVRTIKRVLPHDARPQAAPVQTARLDRKHPKKGQRHDPVIERASLKAHKAPHVIEPPNRAHPVTVPPLPRPVGLMKVSAPRCAQRDPGEALVCADPSLGAADRQLARAYQGARAAGVPDVQLQRQQQHWLAARAAAAREAPWAVHDVYMARIAELNGQARDAHGDGY